MSASFVAAAQQRALDGCAHHWAAALAGAEAIRAAHPSSGSPIKNCLLRQEPYDGQSLSIRMTQPDTFERLKLRFAQRDLGRSPPPSALLRLAPY